MAKPAFRQWEFDVYIKYMSYFNVIILSFVNLTKDTIDLGLIRGLVLFVAAAYFFATKRVRSETFSYLLYFSVYILIMGLVTWSRYNFFPDKALKVLLGSVSFAYGLYFINSFQRFIELNRVFIISILIILVTIIIANLTGVTYKLYADTGFSLGGQGVNIAKNLAIYVLPFPIYLILNRKKIPNLVLRILYILCLIIIAVSLKRGAMLGLLLGTATYFITSARRGKFLRNSLLVIFVLFLAYPIYEPILKETLKAREENFSFTEEDVESEGRFTEFKMTWNDIKHKPVVRTLFGEGVQSEAVYFDINRMHHTDLISILFGAGIVGLVLYILTYYKVYREIRKFRVLDREKPMVREMRAVSYALLLGLIGLSVSGVYHTIDLRAASLLYMGGCIGLMRSYVIARKSRSAAL